MQVFLRVGGSDREDSEVPLPEQAIACTEELLQGVLMEILPELERFSRVEASLSYVGEDEIRELNAEYREQDQSTDVLSFPLWEEDGRFCPPSFNEVTELVLGDIVVCPDVVRRQALETGVSPLRENLLVVIHGFLHLIGFDHAEEEERTRMWVLQDSLLERALEGMASGESGEGFLS